MCLKHFNEPPIIDVTNYDDNVQAIEDGRLDRIIDEHLSYMKETGTGKTLLAERAHTQQQPAQARRRPSVRSQNSRKRPPILFMAVKFV